MRTNHGSVQRLQERCERFIKKERKKKRWFGETSRQQSNRLISEKFSNNTRAECGVKQNTWCVLHGRIGELIWIRGSARIHERSWWDERRGRCVVEKWRPGPWFTVGRDVAAISMHVYQITRSARSYVNVSAHGNQPVRMDGPKRTGRKFDGYWRVRRRIQISSVTRTWNTLKDSSVRRFCCELLRASRNRIRRLSEMWELAR